MLRMLLDRLTQEEFLPVTFKEYYTFTLHGTTATSHDVRFSLSASSIDAIYTVFRDSNYQTAGVKTRQYQGVSLSDANCSNALFFKSFNNSSTSRGALRYSYTCNNVKHPQYDADVLDAAHDLSMVADQMGHTWRGHMVTSLTHFNNVRHPPTHPQHALQPLNAGVGTTHGQQYAVQHIRHGADPSRSKCDHADYGVAVVLCGRDDGRAPDRRRKTNFRELLKKMRPPPRNFVGLAQQIRPICHYAGATAGDDESPRRT